MDDSFDGELGVCHHLRHPKLSQIQTLNAQGITLIHLKQYPLSDCDTSPVRLTIP
jgi:hypothetical protein